MKAIFSAFLILILSGCHSTSYVNQIDNESYIQLNGNYAQSTIKVGALNFQITDQTKTFELNGNQVVKFEIPKGKHQLTVSKDGRVIINKYIFASEGQTVEVTIP